MNTLPLRLCCISIALLLGTAHAANAPVAPATSQPSMGDPTIPAVKTGKSGPLFLQMHEKFLKEAKEGNIDLLFLGDSITANWTKAPEIWAKNYAPLHAANFGIGGDRTQHVLWRITNGELDGIHPKVCVLMIGTNNSNSDNAEPIADAITKIVSIVREKTGAKVLLLAVFPAITPVRHMTRPWRWRPFTRLTSELPSSTMERTCAISTSRKSLWDQTENSTIHFSATGCIRM